MTDESWTPPLVSALRATGFTGASGDFPRSERCARWFAAWNGIAYEAMPVGWLYASNAYMLAWAEQNAAAERPPTAGESWLPMVNHNQ